VQHVQQSRDRAAERAKPKSNDPEARLKSLRTANNELAHLLMTSEHQRRSADSVTKVLRYGLHRLGEGDPLSGLMYLTMESMNFKRLSFIKPDLEDSRLTVSLSSAMRGSQRVPEQSWVPFPTKTRAFGIPATVNAQDEAPEHRALLGLLGVQSCVVAPLVDQQGKCHGYLAADKGKAGGTPAPGDDQCLGIIADQACLLLEFDRMTREMQRMATIDPLTGAATRRRLMDRLEHLVTLSERTHQPLSVALMDLDHFKRFNDTMGHQVGDRLLIDLVRVLSANVRKTDLVARYGGEEFVVVLAGAPLAGASIAAEELRKAVYDFGHEHAELYNNMSISISIGIAELKTSEGGVPAEDAMSLIGRADQALYRAKHNGRNRVEAA
jgi:diguanylate cyclase (GGDEF)-like protein